MLSRSGEVCACVVWWNKGLRFACGGRGAGHRGVAALKVGRKIEVSWAEGELRE